METHRRLAPCPAALEDRELGPSTGIEVEIEEEEVCGHDRSGGSEFWLFGYLHRWNTAVLTCYQSGDHWATDVQQSPILSVVFYKYIIKRYQLIFFCQKHANNLKYGNNRALIKID